MVNSTVKELQRQWWCSLSTQWISLASLPFLLNPTNINFGWKELGKSRLQGMGVSDPTGFPKFPGCARWGDWFLTSSHSSFQLGGFFFWERDVISLQMYYWTTLRIQTEEGALHVDIVWGGGRRKKNQGIFCCARSLIFLRAPAHLIKHSSQNDAHTKSYGPQKTRQKFAWFRAEDSSCARREGFFFWRCAGPFSHICQ